MRLIVNEEEKDRIFNLYGIKKTVLSEQIRSATDLVPINLGPYGEIKVGVKPNFQKNTLQYFMMDDSGETFFNLEEFFTRKFQNLGRKVNYHDFLKPLFGSPVYRGDAKSSNSIIEALNVLLNQIKPAIERNIK